ncbi:M14 family metallopeptidase [Lagierella sp.]|uniref:M14 family metallopeptidase n=1 Tax=Lagierella sp. TaxID=2849657 RepID=UPI002603A465|nr:M14 family metallopeptidase [Lagierella sp.]
MKIKIKDSYEFEEIKNLLIGSYCLGVLQEDENFPITSKNGKLELFNGLDNLEKHFKKDDYSNKRPLENMKFEYSRPFSRKPETLECLFSPDFLMRDTNGDGLCDDADFSVVVEDTSPFIVEALSNLMYRFGLEATGGKLPKIIAEENDENFVKFVKDDRIYIEFSKNSPKQILIHGDGEDLVKFVVDLCRNFPFMDNKTDLFDYIKQLEEMFSLKTVEGQYVFLNSTKIDKDGSDFLNSIGVSCDNFYKDDFCYFEPNFLQKFPQVKEEFPNMNIKSYKDPKEIWSKDFEVSWEVDEFLNILEKNLSSIELSDEVEVFGILSEDDETLNSLELKIKKRLNFLQIPAKINLVSGYKQGISYFIRQIYPQIKDKKIENIVINFNPFLQEGQEFEDLESGSVPSYSIEEGSTQKFLDMPIRLLQELYPIDDIIEKLLGISREKVTFQMNEVVKEADYEFIIHGFNGKEEVFKYSPKLSEKPYLKEYPNLGLVHPNTGYFRIDVNGQVLNEQNIKTDVEKIWDIYQENVLPKVLEIVQENSGVSESDQPFFNCLKLEVEASEPDMDLEIRQDRISSLEGLHQDMYFCGLDYFSQYGLKNEKGNLDSPGLILPKIKKRNGKPKFKASLYKNMGKSPGIFEKDCPRVLTSDGKKPVFKVEEIGYNCGELKIYLDTNLHYAVLESLSDLVKSNKIKIYPFLKNFKKKDFQIVFRNDNGEYPMVSEVEKSKDTVKVEDINFYEDEIIDYDRYLKIINELKKIDRVNVVERGRSYLGRSIYSIEFTKTFVSRRNQVMSKPTLFINNRHHANEVSSTNAAFMLIKKILTDDRYKDLEEDLNLIIVPMENVDGTQIHYELQKENPNWKLHVARFNSLGKEFFRDCFNEDTIHSEAHAFTRIYHRYLPDMVIDNHGVPSHEWDQQFSGYSSPSYRGFWLPRSLMYGYFWYVKGDDFSDNFHMNKVIEEEIAKGFERNIEFTKSNLEWKDRFEKYAHSYMPNMFPAKYYKNMIHYWVGFDYDINHRYVSIKYPHITSVAYTSEVADETAQGEYLNKCARAHLLHDEIIIDLIRKQDVKVFKNFENNGNAVIIYNKRLRPLVKEEKWNI